MKTVSSKHSLVMLVLLCLMGLSRHTCAADNLLLVTIDGLRWQEVFRGYQDDILNLVEQDTQKMELVKAFSGDSKYQKRKNLMPFLWGSVANEGVIIGNRDLGSKMRVSNQYWFSYPGYNEILTGRADPKIASNQDIPNPNVTFIEWLNHLPEYEQGVAVFGSWDVFPFIVNRQRSKLVVNAGFESANWKPLSQKAQWLNHLQKRIPSPWHNVRLDAFTAGFASEYIQQHRPKIIYLALGETDDFAHQGNYPEYLKGAYRSDQIIADLWGQLQTIPEYKNNINLVITVDHGRGQDATSWQHHASPRAVQGYLKKLASYQKGIIGAEQVWLAAMGPDIKSLGEMSQGQDFQLDQVAATCLQALNIEPTHFAHNIGPALPIVNLLN
jgi:hypothetical protein